MLDNKRKLTPSEIEFILDFLKPSKLQPGETSRTVNEITKSNARVQLEDIIIYPSMIDELKNNIQRDYNSSLISPGECVGILCAQSIGEKNTQTALNTFHKAGQSEKTITEGVPRFQELINTTKHQKIVCHTLYTKRPYTEIEEIINSSCGKLTCLYTSDIYENIITLEDITGDDEWYEIYKLLYDDEYSGKTRVVRLKINMKKVSYNKITLSHICKKINDKLPELTCIFSPIELGIVDIFTDISHLNTEVSLDIKTYVEECIIPELNTVHICGIEGVSEIFYTRDNDIWKIETNATTEHANTYKNILSLPWIDKYKTISNNIWDIYVVLGVEACRKMMIKEFISIMEGINISHVKLLVDRMLYDGNIQSISRYTLKQDNSGVLGKASFEESLDNFLNACMKGECDPTKGVSASIMCGKRCKTGSGMVDLKINLKNN